MSKIKKYALYNDGNTLIIVMMVFFVFSIFAIGLMQMGSFSNVRNINEFNNEQARMIARSTALAMRDYILNNGGEDLFLSFGVPNGGGYAQISTGVVSVSSNRNVGEADNVSINVVDPGASLNYWRVTLQATGYYPSIEEQSSGVKAEVVFQVPKNIGDDLDSKSKLLFNNTISAMNDNIIFNGNATIVGSVFFNGNITLSGSTRFMKPQTSNESYIRAGRNITFSNAGNSLDITGMDAGEDITINGIAASWISWANIMGIVPPSGASLNNTLIKVGNNFNASQNLNSAASTARLHHLTGKNINVGSLRLAEIRSFSSIEELDMNFDKPINIILKPLPTESDFPDILPISGIISNNGRFPQGAQINGNLFIDASRQDIVLYIGGTVTLGESGSIIINDGRNGDKSNSVTIIIGENGSLNLGTNRGSIVYGTSVSSIDNNIVPELYVISESTGNIITVAGTTRFSGYIVAPNSSLTMRGTTNAWFLNPPYARNFYGSAIVRNFEFSGGDPLIFWNYPIENTMKRIVSRYINEIREVAL